MLTDKRYAALEIICDTDERADYIREWIEGNLKRAVEAGVDIAKEPALRITVSNCSSTIAYWKIEDIPLEDVPCSCGDPMHWFIKYVEAKDADG